MAQGFYTNQVWTGIGTWSQVLPNAGDYAISVKIVNAPELQKGSTATSGIQIVIKDGSTTKFTGAVGAPGAEYTLSGAAAGDTLNIVFQSSVAQDQAPNINVIKAQISVAQTI
jgi:hypothetical protein